MNAPLVICLKNEADAQTLVLPDIKARYRNVQFQEYEVSGIRLQFNQEESELKINDTKISFYDPISLQHFNAHVKKYACPDRFIKHIVDIFYTSPQKLFKFTQNMNLSVFMPEKSEVTITIFPTTKKYE